MPDTKVKLHGGPLDGVIIGGMPANWNKNQLIVPWAPNGVGTGPDMTWEAHIYRREGDRFVHAGRDTSSRWELSSDA